MAEPLLQAQIDIDAPVAKFRDWSGDLVRMPKRSPQDRLTKALEPLRHGGRKISNSVFWPTTRPVAEVNSDRTIAFHTNMDTTVRGHVPGPAANGTGRAESERAENTPAARITAADKR